MDPSKRIFVAGHRGLVGSAISRRLSALGCRNLVQAGREEVNLRDQAAVNEFFRTELPEIVILAAAKVGGIHANSTYPADFIYDNLIIQCNVVNAAFENGVTRFVFLGSSCIYPRHCPQPMKEEYLLTGTLEPTNEAYAVAKLAGIKLCEFYEKQYGMNTISLLPTNLYGPGDNFDLQNSHVLPALIRRFHDARSDSAPVIRLWGSGRVRREFMFVDDFADACLFLTGLDDYRGTINVGVGEDISIHELALIIAGVVGYGGQIEFDPSQPDGMPRKLLDVSRLTALGWSASTDLVEGIKTTYEWYRQAIATGAARLGS
jgi:GDP-L-fucose synthase